jgi:GxxExxY protein
MLTKKFLTDLTYTLVGASIEVHKDLGPGLLESVYEKCFKKELALKGVNFQSQLYVPIIYKGVELDTELRLDLLVEDAIVVELKAMDAIAPIHQAQLLTYMRLLQKPKGLLINFNCTNIFKEGQKTMVNDLYALLPEF